ncbi:MAG: hypothetical protein AB7P49_17585 [Bdellovibrionales bacterium]
MGVDKGVTKFTTWKMTHPLVSALVNRLGTYREVGAALGIPDSTFADALRTRHFGFFEDLADALLSEICAKTNDRQIKKAIRHLWLLTLLNPVSTGVSLINQVGDKRAAVGARHR